VKPKLLRKVPIARELTQRQWLDIAIGPAEYRPAGWSRAEYREAWELHRSKFMAACNACTRPGGWWVFESPQPRDPSVDEGEQLAAMGVLRPDEAPALAWRRACRLGKGRVKAVTTDGRADE
jgi:hypothetical protein